VTRLRLAAILSCYAISLSFSSRVSADNAADTASLSAKSSEGGSSDKLQVLSAEDLTREGSANLTGALNFYLSSININDDLDDPVQPDILYRGFEASPVVGIP